MTSTVTLGCVSVNICADETRETVTPAGAEGFGLSGLVQVIHTTQPNTQTSKWKQQVAQLIMKRKV